MNVVLFVVLLILAIAVIQAAIWIPLIRWARRKTQQTLASMISEAEQSGERLVLGPESGVYRGGTGSYGKVKGNGAMLLTDRRLVFRKLMGAGVEIPTITITGSRRSKGFNGARTGGKTHLIVTTAEAEVGFFVSDIDAWERAIESARPPA